MGLFSKKTTVAVIETAKPAPATPEIDLAALAPEEWAAYEAAASVAKTHAADRSRLYREVADIEAAVARLEAEAVACRAAHETRTRARLSGQPIPPESGRAVRDVAADLELARLDLAVARSVLVEATETADDAGDRSALAFRRVMASASEALVAEAVAAVGDRLDYAHGLLHRAAPGDRTERLGEFVARVLAGGRHAKPLPADVPTTPGGPVDFGFEVLDRDDDDARTGQAEAAGF